MDCMDGMIDVAEVEKLVSVSDGVIDGKNFSSASIFSTPSRYFNLQSNVDDGWFFLFAFDFFLVAVVFALDPVDFDDADSKDLSDIDEFVVRC